MAMLTLSKPMTGFTQTSQKRRLARNSGEVPSIFSAAVVAPVNATV